VSQHMPPRFTQAFAERLDKLGKLEVREAADGDRLRPGLVLIAPGGGQLEVAQGGGGALVARVRERRPSDRFAPSADLLFESGAKALGAASLAVVLTGMGNDGASGAKAVKAAGGEVWAESEESAVVFGMPQAAIANGAVERVLPLGELCQELAKRLKGS
jgi:two-component system chemotaxis response regulator CheB